MPMEKMIYFIISSDSSADSKDPGFSYHISDPAFGAGYCSVSGIPRGLGLALSPKIPILHGTN